MTETKTPPVTISPPQEVVLSARAVMGAIDLDPFGTVDGNRLVQSARYFNRDQEDVDSICAREWTCSEQGRVFIAPIGGAVPTRRLLNKTLREYRNGSNLKEAVIWLSHNESLTRLPWLWNFPLCIPFRRFRPAWYDDETDMFRTVSPAFWSPVIYLPPVSSPQQYDEKVMRFYAAFSGLGRIVHDTVNGSDDWEDAYEHLTGSAFDYRA